LSEQGKAKRSVGSWIGTAVFFSYTHLSHDLCTGLLSPLLGFIQDYWAISYFRAGLLVSFFTITSGVSQFFGGWLGDRFSWKALMVAGMIGVGITTALAGLSPNYYVLLAILITMGVFSGAYHPSAASMLSGSVDEQRSGRSLAVYLLGGTIGFAAGPVLGGLIAGDWGWKSAYLIFSIPTILAVFLIFKKFKQKDHSKVSRSVASSSAETRESAASDESVAHKISLLKALKPVAVVMILSVLVQSIAGSVVPFIPKYLNEKFDVELAHGTMLISVLRGGGILGTILGGLSADKWGRRFTIFFGLIITGPVLYMLTEMPFGAWLIVAFILFGLAIYMRGAAMLQFIVEKTPLYFRATVLGVYFGFGRGGMSLFNPITGRLIDVYGIDSTFSGIAIAGIALSIASVLLVWSPKRKA